MTSESAALTSASGEGRVASAPLRFMRAARSLCAALVAASAIYGCDTNRPPSLVEGVYVSGGSPLSIVLDVPEHGFEDTFILGSKTGASLFEFGGPETRTVSGSGLASGRYLEVRLADLPVIERASNGELQFDPRDRRVEWAASGIVSVTGDTLDLWESNGRRIIFYRR